jgi:hypothetical protein
VGVEGVILSLVIITGYILDCKISGSGFIKSRLTAVGIRCAGHGTGTNFSDKGGRLVGIVLLRTKATEFYYVRRTRRIQLYICRYLLRM